MSSSNYDYDAADLTWMMVSSALVLLMVPAIGLLYSGMSNRSTIYMTWMPIITTATVGLVWFLWGYAIAFSPSSSSFWGGSSGAALHDVLVLPVGNEKKIPELLFALYQGMFACFTASIVSGATIYKERTLRWLTFVVFWVTFVYCPIARWTWNKQGWSNKWGTLDFAGGTPVHITSGTSAVAYSLFYRLQLRRFNKQERAHNGEQSPELWLQGGTERAPQHVWTVLMGTILLWIGWLGFNGGSALGANMRAVSACVSTHIAASAGGVMACAHESFYEWLRVQIPAQNEAEELQRKRAKLERLILQFCNGAVVGLVAVTPAAGYISPYYAPLFGIIGEFFSYYSFRLSIHLFDTLDIFAIHTVGGFVGMMLTGLFAKASVARLDGSTEINGGAIDGNGKQIYKQLVDSLAGFAYSFVVTFLILCVLNLNAWFGKVRKPRLVLD